MEAILESPEECQQFAASRTQKQLWPKEVKQRARNMVIKLSWSIAGTADQLAIPNGTLRGWAEEEGWIKLRRKADAKAIEKVRAEIESPVQVVKTEDIQPVDVSTPSRVDRILRQIDRLDADLDDPKSTLTPRQRVELINAKATLWGLIHAKVGTVKPGKRRSSSNSLPDPVSNTLEGLADHNL